MNSVTCSISPNDIALLEPEVIVDVEEPASNSTFPWSPSSSRELNSTSPWPPSSSRELNSTNFIDTERSTEGDFLDVEESCAKLECKSEQTEWSPEQQGTAIQINGSVVIVQPEIKHELVPEAHSRNVEAQAEGNMVITSSKQRCNSRGNSLTSVVEKLARNGVAITCNEFQRIRYPSHSMLKMKTSPIIYNPSLPSPTPDPKRWIRTGKVKEVKMQKKRLFSECPKTSKRFVCCFCDRLFKSLEFLRSHHEIHGIRYYKTPYSWMEEATLSQDMDMGGICLIEIPENQEGSYEGFTCQVCDMIFASVGGLSKHMDVHRISYNKKRIEDQRESISEEGHAMIDLTD